MKRIIKSLFKKAWGLTGPVRRPIVRRVDAHLAGLVRACLAPELDRLSQGVAAARCVSEGLAAESNLVMDNLVREMTRLQRQIELMSLESRSHGHCDHGLKVVGQCRDHHCGGNGGAGAVAGAEQKGREVPGSLPKAG